MSQFPHHHLKMGIIVIHLTLKLLQKRFGSLSETIQGQIAQLSVERLESLAEELLDFNNVDELVGWLDRD